ncbi:hypothetical protein GCM10009560_29750 [Nonomuraea longicatena]|uniref:Uncharacterized protein n=1 Tax=Nonomuraea longicatena TaxID=83682 RepID=A0ABN1PFH7_9ACTN
MRPSEAAELLATELSAWGINADPQPSRNGGDTWVSVWTGLLVRCDGLTFSWTPKDRRSAAVHYAPADSPRAAAEMVAAHYRLLVARYPAPTCRLQGLEAAMPQ